MKLKSNLLGALVLVILFGGIALTSALNLWTTETTKVPVVFDSGEAAGEYNPDDIRGSYSFGDISDLFDIPLQDLATAFGLPEDVDAAAFQNKELEEIYGDLEEAGTEIGNSSVKLFVALYKDLPFEIDDDIYLPVQAVEILKAQGNLNEEQLVYLDAHTVDLEQALAEIEQTAGEEAAPTPAEGEETAAAEAESTPQLAVTEEDHVPEEGQVTGKTTFYDLLDWGVPQETIEEILGGPMPATGTLVKDYVTSQGLSFSEVRTQLQEAMDAVVK